MSEIVTIRCRDCGWLLGAVLAGAEVRCPKCRAWTLAGEARQKPQDARKRPG